MLIVNFNRDLEYISVVVTARSGFPCVSFLDHDFVSNLQCWVLISVTSIGSFKACLVPRPNNAAMHYNTYCFIISLIKPYVLLLMQGL